MSKPADTSAKKLISLAPDNWVRWVTNILVRDIMRWDMAVLRESPWYQEILQEGEARGEARRIVSSIGTILQAKFGSQGVSIL